MSIIDALEKASGGTWSMDGCTEPHSADCHAAFQPDCPKFADLNRHMSEWHTGPAIDCPQEPCVSSPWFHP